MLISIFLFTINLGLPKIFIEPEPNLILTPIFFKILDANFNLGLSFLFNSSSFLKLEIPFAFAASKKLLKIRLLHYY